MQFEITSQAKDALKASLITSGVVALGIKNEQTILIVEKALLEKIHNEFIPLYVLSTSWRLFMNRDALVVVLVNTGLEFVARNLHEHWQTPEFMSPQLRAREIGSWRGYDRYKNWVVLDDERSGTGFGEDYPFAANRPFIVLCREGFGLQACEYEKLRAAFGLRLSLTDLKRGGHHRNS